MTATASDPPWRGQERRIELRGASYRLRLVRFPAGWLASVDTVEGPTLGYDSSPYLAVSRAVEPIGGGLDDAMAIVAEVRATTHTVLRPSSARVGTFGAMSNTGAPS
jgi:hypothetical protein